MADINWEEAPEGTTHHLESVRFDSQYWLKREGDHYRWRSVHLDHLGYPEGHIAPWAAAYDNPELYTLTERPPQAPQVVEQPQPAEQVVRINGVEVDWGKAPEGTTHAATDIGAIRAYGQWRKLEDNTVSDWKRGEWVARDFINAEEWKRTNRGQFIEKPGLVAAAPVAKKEQPVVKKPVGWWS